MFCCKVVEELTAVTEIRNSYISNLNLLGRKEFTCTYESGKYLQLRKDCAYQQTSWPNQTCEHIWIVKRSCRSTNSAKRSIADYDHGTHKHRALHPELWQCSDERNPVGTTCRKNIYVFQKCVWGKKKSCNPFGKLTDEWDPSSERKAKVQFVLSMVAGWTNEAHITSSETCWVWK